MKEIKLNDIINYVINLEKENEILKKENQFIMYNNKEITKDKLQERYDNLKIAFRELAYKFIFVYCKNEFNAITYEKYLKNLIDFNMDKVPTNLSRNDMYYLCFGFNLEEYNAYWENKRKEEEKEESEENI